MSMLFNPGHEIKSFMQFLGQVHEVNATELERIFQVTEKQYLRLNLSKELCAKNIVESKDVFFPKEIPNDHKGDFSLLNDFKDFEHAYYQLMFEISKRVYEGIKLILDSSNNLKDVYISGGFDRNKIFIEYLTQMMPEQKIRFHKGKCASALGAAMLMKSYLD